LAVASGSAATHDDRVNLWRSIVGGFGSRVGSELAKKGLDELDDGDAKESEEEAARASTRRKRKIAAIVVAISLLGLLALSGALTAIFKWLLGAAFVAGLLGGGWYLGRNRWYALRASMKQKKVEAIEERARVDQRESLEAQLAELKRKKAEEDQ
jgi:hypothetical protein